MVTRQTAEATALGAFVERYRASNDRFEAWLNQRDAEHRERTRERLLARGAPGRALLSFGERVERALAPFAGLSGEVARELAAGRR